MHLDIMNYCQYYENKPLGTRWRGGHDASNHVDILKIIIEKRVFSECGAYDTKVKMAVFSGEYMWHGNRMLPTQLRKSK
jgi:hypothetical protein